MGKKTQGIEEKAKERREGLGMECIRLGHTEYSNIVCKGRNWKPVVYLRD